MTSLNSILNKNIREETLSGQKEEGRRFASGTVLPRKGNFKIRVFQSIRNPIEVFLGVHLRLWDVFQCRLSENRAEKPAILIYFETTHKALEVIDIMAFATFMTKTFFL